MAERRSSRCWRLQTTRLSEIDLSDRRFSITPDWMKRQELSDSIRLHGILTPVLLRCRRDGVFQIIRGFGRLQTAASVGMSDVPACLTDDPDPARLFLEALEENLLNRPLQELEKASAVRLLRDEWDFSPQRIIEEILPRLALKPHKTVLQRLLALADLSTPLQKATAAGLEIDIALRLASRPAPFRRFVVQVVDRHRLGRNKQREFFELFDDLRSMEGPAVDPARLWVKIGAAAIEDRRDLSPNDRWQGIMSCLMGRRYPRLRAQQLRFQQLRATLGVSPGIEIEAPANFEGGGLRLILKPVCGPDLEKQAVQLQAWAASDELQEMIEMF